MLQHSIHRMGRVARSGLVLLMISFLGFSPALAQQSNSGLSDPEELESFMDGLLQAQKKAHDIAGATVAVVKDGSIFFSKGYGYANLRSRTPVDPARTLFRIGSVSKLFVWTAVMQQVEQGTLDLDRDVNAYLGQFQIPNTFKEPVTMTHLMTHTPGFEDQVIGLFAESADRVRPLGEILAQELPSRVRPPGQISSYSNHGTGIAAYAVEQISGQSWNEYVEQRILEPLKMRNTTFRQPVPKSLEASLSRGYSYGDGRFREEAFEYVPLAPVGGASTTAEDMAKFMVAHLQLGRFGDRRILQAGTAQRMQEPLFRPAPGVNGMCYGFMEHSMNGRRVIGHGGDTVLFHSLLALLPEEKVGLFVSYNSKGGSEVTRTTYEAFMNRYYPAAPLRASSASPETANRLRRFAGTYRAARYSHTTLAKLAVLFMTFKVTVTEDGILQIPWPEQTRWISTAPLTFREEHSLKTLAFRENHRGKITHLFLGDMPFMAFERIGWPASPTFHLILLIVAFLLFMGVLIFYPSAAVIRRRCGVAYDADQDIPIPATVLLWLTCLFLVAFAIGLLVALRDPMVIAFGVPAGLKVLLVLPLLALVGTIGTLAYTLVIWMSARIGTGRRLYYTATTIMCVAALWQLDYWNLLGFRF